MVKLANTQSKMHKRVLDKAAERAELGSDKVKPNTFWDDARVLYEKSISALDYTHGQLGAHLENHIKDPIRLGLIEDPVTLTKNIDLLTRDIAEHVARLNAIYADHSDKYGSAEDPDAIMAVISINGRYSDALEAYETVIAPTVTQIFEQIGAIDELIACQEKEAMDKHLQQLQDVNVVSDVEIKTPQEETPHV